MAVTGLDKVFVVNAETNTKYGGVDPTGEFVTINDLVPQPYKVYTALLTQSGGDDSNIKEAGDSLNIGVTYLIGNGDNYPGDFMNVGAPNNDEGTSFVATGETPTKWGKTTLEYNAGAPVVTVLENTIGDIWFTYNSIGAYLANSNSLFTINKTVTQMLPEQYIESPADIYNYQSFPIDVNLMAIGSFFNYDVEDSRIGGFSQNVIEIRVYD